jgi:hypothetical protein
MSCWPILKKLGLLMRQLKPLVASAIAGYSGHGQTFVYSEEESTWMTVGDQDTHATDCARAKLALAVMPLTLASHATSPDRLEEVRSRVARLAHAELIQRYRVAYANGKRLIAGIMATELIERNVPPCFWHEVLALDSASVDQRADLVLADLAWVRRWYPEHASSVRYRRGKRLLTGSDADFRREVQFAFYDGRRPAWKLVSSMSMTEHQQWDAAYLRSAPIKRQAERTDLLQARVWQALNDDLQTARRTVAFTDADAQASLSRRFALWHCSRMVKDGSPTEIARRYHQNTGMSITRQAAAKQLQKVFTILRAKGADFTS